MRSFEKEHEIVILTSGWLVKDVYLWSLCNWNVNSIAITQGYPSCSVSQCMCCLLGQTYTNL